MDIDTQTHLSTLRELLDYRLSDLEAEIHSLQQRRAATLAAADSSEVIDFKEQSSRDQAVDLTRIESLRLGDELVLVQAALRRLDEGVYGDCLDCGEAIAFDRLRVQPQALRCAACQARFERHVQSR